MAHDTQWWKRTKKEKKCDHCGKTDICFEWQKEGTAKCGYNRLCETKCYENLVHHVHKQYITRRQFFPCLFTGIIGLFIGGGIVYTLIEDINNFIYLVIITERQKQILVGWALEKAENVSSQVIRQMVDTACESRFPYLVMSIIGAETVPKFNPGSISNVDKKGKRTKVSCLGPMQVNPNVWMDELREQCIINEEEDLFDPVLGVRAGIYIFEKELVKAKGNLRKATEGYVGLIHNTKDAARYFDAIQRHLGEIYLAIHLADKKQEKEGESDAPGKRDN
jgi:hypothetical protein